MPEKREVNERYWSVCYKWKVPYPCRKTRLVTKWCYDFSFVVISKRGIYTNNWGCEFNNRYKWRDWHIVPVGFGDSTVYFVEMCFKSQRDSDGVCSSATAVDYLKRTLGPDLSRVLHEANADKGIKE